MMSLESRVLLSAWYVSTAGADSNPGTLDQPFATIQQAADVSQPGDTIYLRGGVYHQTVTPPRSGADGAPITFQPYAGESVTIDGADPLTGWLRNRRSSVFQSSMAWDLGPGQNQVFVDGRMLGEAQWPPAGPKSNAQPFATVAATRAGAPAGGLSTATISVRGLNQPPGAWVGATIHLAPGQQWVFQAGIVIASAPGSLTFTYQQLQPAQYQMISPGDRFYLTGSPAAFGAPGQWYRDPSTGVLSLRPSRGHGPVVQRIEARHRLYAFDLSGRSYINIVGLHLFACTINTDAASSHLTIDGIDAQYASHDTIEADPWEDKFHPHTSGIILNGTANVLQNSTIAFSSGDGVFLGGSGNTVRNCVIHDVDYSGFDYGGVSTLGANETVTGNTIYNCARDGIVARYSPACSITHNRIYNCGLSTTDAGGIYTFQTDGQGSQIAYNLVSGIHTGGFGGAGIYLDNGSSNYLVHHNVVWNTDIGVKMNPPSHGNQLYNNTLVSPTSLDTGSSPDLSGSVLINNLFVGRTMASPGASISSNLTDPRGLRFVNPRRGDYQLRSHSAGIDAGQIIPSITDGYLGKAPDAGAYEFGDAPFSAGSGLSIRKRVVATGLKHSRNA